MQSRGPGGSKRITLGRHGELTVEQARKQAVAVIDRIKRGENPVAAPPEPAFTVADLAERYMEAHVAVNCNAHTQGIYRGSLDNHILPALGAMPIASVGRSEAAALHYELRNTPARPTGRSWCCPRCSRWPRTGGLAPAGGNPCRFVRKYKEGKRERFLTEDEYRRIGCELCVLEAEGPLSARAAAALRLLMLTGCRLNEILTLRWDDVDRKAGELRLRDSKTGARMVPLTPTAIDVLAGIDRVPGAPGCSLGLHRTGICRSSPRTGVRVWARAGVEDVRIHDLRHSFASRALALGESLTMIGRLLGHTDVGSTARYAHLARDAEKTAVARVGGSIEADILRTESAARRAKA